jgi:hypothetical protein
MMKIIAMGDEEMKNLLSFDLFPWRKSVMQSKLSCPTTIKCITHGCFANSILLDLNGFSMKSWTAT